VAYKDAGNANKATVKKLNTEGTGWETVGTAGFSAGTASYTSLAIYNGTPYVAYQDYENADKATVMKLNTAGTGWETVGTAGFSTGTAYYTSLAIYNGTPYVAYGDYGNGYKATVMKFAEAAPATPEIDVLQDANAIANETGTYDFGSHNTATETDVTFTIENTGTGASTLETLTLSNTTDFSFVGENPATVQQVLLQLLLYVLIRNQPAQKLVMFRLPTKMPMKTRITSL